MFTDPIDIQTFSVETKKKKRIVELTAMPTLACTVESKKNEVTEILEGLG